MTPEAEMKKTGLYSGWCTYHILPLVTVTYLHLPTCTCKLQTRISVTLTHGGKSLSTRITTHVLVCVRRLNLIFQVLHCNCSTGRIKAVIRILFAHTVQLSFIKDCQQMWVFTWQKVLMVLVIWQKIWHTVGKIPW